jgi:hypothetical protein
MTRVELRFGKERFHERADVETGPSNDDDIATLRVTVRDRGASERGESRGGVALVWSSDVDADMRHLFELVRRWLRGADVEAAVHLPRVGADDDGAGAAGERECEC